MRGRHPVRDAGVTDLVLGPDQALGHRRLGDQERPRDLGGGQAGQGAQGERDPRLQRQRRMAAGEHQPQPVVADPAVIVLAGVVGWRQGGHLPQLRRLGRAAAQPVQRAVARHRGQPGAGPARHAVARPASAARWANASCAHSSARSQSPVDPDQGRDDPAPLLAERRGDGVLDVCGHVRPERPHLDGPEPGRPGAWPRPRSPRRGRRTRSCRSPPICSLVSANGPSATSTSPPRIARSWRRLPGGSGCRQAHAARRRSPSPRPPCRARSPPAPRR